jgi:curli biogenesis system outer membrane secretion channel CsgG
MWRMVGLSVILLGASGSAVANTTAVKEIEIGRWLPQCASPVATVVVGKFQCRAQTCQQRAQMDPRLAGLMALAAASGEIHDFSTIGEGMGNAVTTALKATNCFEVQEREALDELRKEMELAGIKLEAKPADYMIIGAITSVGVETQRTSIGGGFIPIIGAVTSKKQIANLAMDIRVVDVKSASVKHSKSFAANSESQSWGLGAAGFGGGGGLFGGHSVSKSPEMDRVATETVVHAVHYVVEALAGPAITRRPNLAEMAKKAPEAEPPSATAQPTQGN